MPQKGIDSVSLGGFLVPRMKPLGEFFCLASEPYYVFGAFSSAFEGCPGFVSYGANAEAGE